MKPAPFRYARPDTLAAAVDLLSSSDGEARILAGGQSLVPMLNMRLVRPAVLVDLNGLRGLDGIAADGAGLAFGALVRHSDLVASSLVRERAPLLAEAAGHVGHVAIRNRGTLGGSLAHADPAAELPAAMLALDARFDVRGPRGARTIEAADFFRGPFSTALAPDEIVIEVRVASHGAGWGFAEVARRPGDFALAGVVAVLTAGRPESRRYQSARLVAFGVADRPVRLRAAERALAGAALDGRSAARAAAAAPADCEPPDDVHASADYRRHLAAVLTEDVVAQAIARLDRAR
jgi:aerobic carbon-monoxide dehydrogenase medium subunit